MGIAKRAPFPYGAKAITHLLRTVHFRRRGVTLDKSGMYEVFFYLGSVFWWFRPWAAVATLGQVRSWSLRIRRTARGVIPI